MNIRKINWQLWAGFLLSLIAFLSYFFFFALFPVTRDFPWANLALFALSAVLLLWGLRRAFSSERLHPMRSKILGVSLGGLSVAVFGFFIFFTLIMPRWLPASAAAPKVGSTAPDFSLTDTSGKVVSLTDLLSSPVNAEAGNAQTTPKGVLLIFYRGYW